MKSIPWWQSARDGNVPLPYMLIDCAGFEGGVDDLPRAAFSELECLFTGDLSEELADVGGYLGRLASWGDGDQAIVIDLLTRQLGVLLTLGESDASSAKAGRHASSTTFSQLHRHLRKFNVVYGPEGQPLFFRYYDPRALPGVLRVLDGKQLDSFYGPIDSVVVFDELQGLVRMTVSNGNFEEVRFPWAGERLAI